MTYLEQVVDDWPAGPVALALTSASRTLVTLGELDRSFELASVTKLLSALAVLVAVEEGTVGLDDLVGPPGATLAHLLAHASGLGPEAGPPLARVGARRIYSNYGFELAAGHVETRSGLAFADYLAEGVLAPLGLTATALRGSPAHGAVGTAADLLLVARELLAPTLLAPETLRRATSPAFGELDGVLPGFGPQRPCPWGLGFEIKGAKAPHWTGATNSPRTFGHFGRGGSFLWADPDLGLALVVLTGIGFGPWAIDAWPRLADALIARFADGGWSAGGVERAGP
ncbi:MAG: serine hydrolase domain-containing protein [Acidimicrobiales bacterium]